VKVLVTGVEGFIGSHVYDILKLKGCNVIGIDSMDPAVHLDRTPKFPETTVCKVNQIPYTDLMEADVIIHLAAQVSVSDSVTNPEPYCEQNITQTAKLLTDLDQTIANGHELKRFVLASSSSVYGDPPYLPFREDDPCVPTNPYGVSKYAQELLVRNWYPENTEVTALRFFNAYGPGAAMHNPKTGVLANFARAILDGKPPHVTEDGNQVRDFIYVRDVAEAVVRVALSDNYMRDVYNVSTGIPTTMLSAAWQLAKALGTKIEPEVTAKWRAGDQLDVVGSNYQLCQDIEWRPRPFKQGVKDYADAILYGEKK
jgi:nucleoside-diphosphate-sugar epimerase